MRDFDQNQGEMVKHYKIRNMDNGGYYISPRVTFSSLHELVEYYTRTPCPGAGGNKWSRGWSCLQAGDGMGMEWVGDGTGRDGTGRTCCYLRPSKGISLCWVTRVLCLH